MARAVVSVNGVLSGVQHTKGLLVIVTLMGLVCVANSLIDSDHLKIIQEYYEGGLEDAADKKKELENIIKVASNVFEEELEEFHPMLKQIKSATSNSSALQGLSSAVKDFLVKERKQFTENVKAYQKEIDDIWNFVKAQEYGDD